MQLFFDEGGRDAHLALWAGQHRLASVMPGRVLASVRQSALLRVFGRAPATGLGEAGRPSSDGAGVVEHGMCLRPEATSAWNV